MSYYETNNSLNNSNRRILCDLIIDKIFEQGFIGCKDMPKISRQIVEIFPTEDRVCYIKHIKHLPTNLLSFLFIIFLVEILFTPSVKFKTSTHWIFVSSLLQQIEGH